MERVKADKRTLYIGMIVLQSILYGITDVISKQAYATMSVYTFLFLRSLLAMVIMLALWHRQIFTELRQVPVRRYILPALCMSTFFIFGNLALLFTTATNMSFIRSLSALLVPVLGLIFYRQRLKKAEIVLLLGMLVGLYLLCAKGGLSRLGLGEVFALIAAVLVAGSLVFGKSALEHISSKTLSFIQSALATVFCAIAALVTGSFRDTAQIFTPPIFFSVLYAAAGCSLLAYLLQNIALEHVSARRVGVVQCLYPIATAVIAFLVLDERLSVSGILGAGLITFCVVLENLQKDS